LSHQPLTVCRLSGHEIVLARRPTSARKLIGIRQGVKPFEPGCRARRLRKAATVSCEVGRRCLKPWIWRPFAKNAGDDISSPIRSSRTRPGAWSCKSGGTIYVRAVSTQRPSGWGSVSSSVTRVRRRGVACLDRANGQGRSSVEIGGSVHHAVLMITAIAPLLSLHADPTSRDRPCRGAHAADHKLVISEPR
jgi:hypothetical protein